MELQISGKNMEVPPEVQRYAERKLGKLSHYLPSITEAKVEIFEEKTRSPEQRFVVQVTTDSSGTLLRSEERGADLFSVVDKVAAVMNRRIEHHKGKLYDKRRKRKGKMAIQQEAGTTGEPACNSGELIRVKRFGLKPMTVDEAIYQMEALGHDFFLFLNTKTETINLLYLRRDKNYGLIEPELETA